MLYIKTRNCKFYAVKYECSSVIQILKNNKNTLSLELKTTLLRARRYASAVLAVIVYPSVVCLSHADAGIVPTTKTAKRRITQTTPYDSQGL